MQRPPALRLVAWAVFCAAALAAADPPDPGSDGAEAILRAETLEVQARLAEKKVVLLEDHNGDGRHVTALVLFAAPEDRVMRLLSQTARQGEFRAELTGSDVVETYADGTLEQQRMKIMFIKIIYHLRYRVDHQQRRITWELDTSRENDMQRVEGHWELHPLADGRTLGRFSTYVDVGPALPKALQDYATRKNVPKTVDNARRWVDSDGTWRP